MSAEAAAPAVATEGASRLQPLPVAAPARVLALGAFLKNTVCWLDGAQAHWLPGQDSHGDLRDPAACAALQLSVQALQEQAGPGGIAAVAHDMHPDFFSSQWAQHMAHVLDVPAVAVAHHHAHLGTVMAEQGWRTDHAPVLGLALDGVGLGPDGTAWGGEALAVFQGELSRLGSLPPLRLPGGDAAAVSPWRLRLAVGQHLGADLNAQAVRGAVGERLAAGVAHMLTRGLNCPPTTAAGRWFDAVAALLGLCEEQSHEAEAALAVQAAAQAALARRGGSDNLEGHLAHHAFSDPMSDTLWWAFMRDCLALGGVWRTVVASGEIPSDDLIAQRDDAALAFHRLLVARLMGFLDAASHHTAEPVRLALGGGCFFNPLLRAAVLHQGQARGWAVAWPCGASCGDAGLALGQAWVAADVLGRRLALGQKENQ